MGGGGGGSGPHHYKISTRQGVLGGGGGFGGYFVTSHPPKQKEPGKLRSSVKRLNVSPPRLYMSPLPLPPSPALSGDEWWGRGWCERCLWRTASLAVEGVTWRHLAERSPCFCLARARAPVSPRPRGSGASIRTDHEKKSKKRLNILHIANQI